jgi:hypothetical protein
MACGAQWFRAHHDVDDLVAPGADVSRRSRSGAENREKALVFWSRFVEPWKDYEPELRPQLADAQARLTELPAEPAHRGAVVA